MIFRNNDAFRAICKGEQPISRVYKGENLLWSSYNGYWVYLNQLSDVPRMSKASSGTASNLDVSIADNGIRVYAKSDIADSNSTSRAAYIANYVRFQDVNLRAGDKLNFSLDLDLESDEDAMYSFYIYSGTMNLTTRSMESKHIHYAAQETVTAGSAGSRTCRFYPRGLRIPAGRGFLASNVMTVNYTKMFGAGFEPTHAQFLEWYPEYIPYTAGVWMPAPPGVVTAYTKPSFH